MGGIGTNGGGKIVDLMMLEAQFWMTEQRHPYISQIMHSSGDYNVPACDVVGANEVKRKYEIIA